MSNESLKCSQEVRKIPLERFRLPNDGRKWKQAARSRKAFLHHLSGNANADGTFVRNGINFSPSLLTLLKDFAKASYFRMTDALQEIGLLSWTREKHHERRVYTIHLPEQVSYSPDNTPKIREKQVSHSQITGLTFDGNCEEQVSDSQGQVSHSQITGLTSVNHPSLPSEEPSNAFEPSSPTAEKQDGGNGRVMQSDAIAKPSAFGGGQRKEKLSGWRLEFQKEIQEIAADKAPAVMFHVPLPESLFRFVESCDDLERAQFAVTDWLEARSFRGMENVNAVWKMMPDEIGPFLNHYGVNPSAATTAGGVR